MGTGDLALPMRLGSGASIPKLTSYPAIANQSLPTSPTTPDARSSRPDWWRP